MQLFIESPRSNSSNTAVCTKVAKRKDAGQVFILFGFSPLAPNLGEGACVSAGEGGEGGGEGGGLSLQQRLGIAKDGVEVANAAASVGFDLADKGTRAG